MHYSISEFYGNSTDLVKYPHGQHRKGCVDDVVESDEVLIVHGLQKGGGGHTDYYIFPTSDCMNCLLVVCTNTHVDTFFK